MVEFESVIFINFSIQFLSWSVWVAILNIHKVGALNDKLFLTVLETMKPKIRVPVWSYSGENTLPGVQVANIHFILTWQRAEKDHLFTGDLPKCSLSPKVLNSKYHHIGSLSFNMNFEETQTFIS